MTASGLLARANSIITEVKTTDAYRISLGTIAGYRDRLISAGQITLPVSILVVVGREDTRELEAQVRGFAWDMRLISVREGTPLIKKSRALYWTADRNKRAAVSISKRYERKGGLYYWYAYHIPWFLQDGVQGYHVLRCMGRDHAFAIPADVLHPLQEYPNITNNTDRIIGISSLQRLRRLRSPFWYLSKRQIWNCRNICRS